MAKIRLYPPYGTKEEAKSIKFEIAEMSSKDFRLEAEDVTHGKMALIDSVEIVGKNGCMGIIHLDIPEESSQSVISIFVYIKDKIGDSQYKTIQICPLLFSIKEESINKSGDRIDVDPVFVGSEDMCSVRTISKPNSKISFSINKKYFTILTNENGEGSIHFRAKDVSDLSKSSSVQKIPVYIYNFDDNYTQRIFSGSYINILPTSISTYASPLVDPRCDPTSSLYVIPGTWTTPTECISDPFKPDVDPIEPWVPTNGIPASCDSKQGSIPIDSLSCKVFHHSMTLLNNGTVFHAYLSPSSVNFEDTPDGINHIFINYNDSSIDVQVIGNQDVVIEPKGANEDFRIHVQQDLWDALSIIDDNPSSVDIYVVLFNRITGFQRIKVSRREINEYVEDSYVVIGECGLTNVELTTWLFCVNSVFYNAAESPWRYGESGILHALQDQNGNYLQTVNFSVASNAEYIGDQEEIYVYIIAEGIRDNKSQLFFYGFYLFKNIYSFEETDWHQLTYEGNNRNPKAKVDKNNNLHIVWESDRSGKSQLYYGVMGPNSNIISGAALSSFVDKYSEFLSKPDMPFTYTDSSIMEEIEGSEYVIIPEMDTSDLIPDGWNIGTSNGGSVSTTLTSNYLEDLDIQAEAINQSALAIASLQINRESDNPSETVPYSQINYQISFDFQAKITQTSSVVAGNEYYGRRIEEKEIDNLFDTWKNDYTVRVDDSFGNQPIYDKENNSFVIGRRNNVFDRVVPVIGSYKYSNLDNPSSDTFQIKILKEDNNLKDFVIGIMFEKTCFYANNMQNITEYYLENPSDNNPPDYIPNIEECIYTGNGRFVVFIRTQESSNDGRENYILVKEFPEIFDVTELKNYKIILNYREVESNEVENMLYTQNQGYSDKFLGSITLLIDGVPRFSQSFISTLSYDYNYFDIGFGIPCGGYIVADKMYPNKLNIFDNISVNLLFSNIGITSPTMGYDTNIFSISSSVRDNSKFVVNKDNPSASSDHYNMLTLNIDEHGFTQVPITIEGINQSPSVDIGLCSDIHISWQSNRDRYWNIFYSNSTESLSPFRYDTQITDTTSNSLKPSISVCRNGKRMIVWHDNRNGDYGIYAARSLSGDICNDDSCEKKMIANYEDDVTECFISIDFTSLSSGVYKFSLDFYDDKDLSSLYKTISMENNLERWFLNGSSMINNETYDEDGNLLGVSLSEATSYVISYTPDKDDGIFDKVLYVKLVYNI